MIQMSIWVFIGWSFSMMSVGLAVAMFLDTIKKTKGK